MSTTASSLTASILTPSPSSLAQFLRLPASLRTLTITFRHRQISSTKSKIAQDLQDHNEELHKQTVSNGSTNIMSNNSQAKKSPGIPRPSASVLVVSPQNQILLLQRVKQSSSFPSAHVFPGGNVSEYHDGRAPEPDHPDRHVDSDVYRKAAIRETFEESGILLARNNGFGRLIEVPEAEREEGRRLVHGSEMPFEKWLARKGGRADLKGLVPFTRWVTPTNVPKRFTTQMYLYFLPTSASTSLPGQQSESEEEVSIPLPTTDGGKEHTTARFLPAAAWCRLAQEGRIILFPPQFFLLHQIAQFFDGLKSPADYGSISREDVSREELEARRRRLLQFVNSGTPPWTEKCISPTALPGRDGKKRDDGRSVLGLDRPGPEVKDRAGCTEQCVLVEFKKEGPRRLAVISREEALDNGAKL